MNNRQSRRITGIRTWADEDQPRQRIFDSGSQVLSNAELIAAILGSGTSTTKGSLTAVQLGRIILSRHESIRDLAAVEAVELVALPGMGMARSAQLVAAFELGRRVSETPERSRVVLRGPKDVAAHFAPSMRDLHREVFKVAMLNSAARLIRTFTASEGGLAASIVEPRLVFRRAILAHAASIICVHNHPSGNREPSQEDIRITKQLALAGQVVGITLNDHIIIAGDGYTSLAERGFLEQTGSENGDTTAK